MTTTTFSLLQTLKQGWRYLYRGKKAHCFKDKMSLCGKFTISDYEEGGLLPINAFFDKRELCKKCLKVLLQEKK